MYSLDNLAQGQIIPSPRNAGKGHINLPSEGASVVPKRLDMVARVVETNQITLSFSLRHFDPEPHVWEGSDASHHALSIAVLAHGRQP